ncbi:hypothetical protein [Streptomyces sp. NPDC008317]|uniref:hypothetical protein n=1 Tax=Streptomyces sp. NPDC008317 TaxID=3364827 RepID=UPI0036E01776
MTAGTTHLHISAAYPVYGQIMVQAQLVDGATGKDIADSSTNRSTSDLIVNQPYFTPSWTDGGVTSYSASPQIATGAPHAVTERLNIRIVWLSPASAHTTSTQVVFTAAQIAAAGYTPEQLENAVAVRFSADGQNYAVKPWTPGADGSLSIDLPPVDWRADVTQSQYLSFKVAWGLPAGRLVGTIEVRDPQGWQYVGATQTLRPTADVRPAELVPSIFGRDAKGDLWLIPGARGARSSAYYDARSLVGPGWNAYTHLLGTATSASTATTTSSPPAPPASWYYEGTGNPAAPFKPRLKISDGWQAYNTLLCPAL